MGKAPLLEWLLGPLPPPYLFVQLGVIAAWLAASVAVVKRWALRGLPLLLVPPAVWLGMNVWLFVMLAEACRPGRVCP